MDKKIITGLVIFVVAAVGVFGVNAYISSRYQGNSGIELDMVGGEVSKTYTLEELKKYDGTDSSLPIYIGLDGLVYDVTAGKNFYEKGGTYNFLAGKDSSTELHIVGGDIIKKKYPVVGKLVK